jgi:hypothetical protein
MERSRAAEVDAATGGLAKSLALLLVARRELHIDGLTGAQIATVLTDKFRSRITRQAVGQAMDTAGNRVDRTKQKGAVVYRIMNAGEQWLAAPRDETTTAANGAGQTKSTMRRRKKAKTTAKAPTKDNTTGGTQVAGTQTAPRTVSRRPGRGPKASVETLIETGWFATPRDLTAVRVELENRLALHYKPTDLAPAMTRLLREGRVRRTKNESGQYEYQS